MPDREKVLQGLECCIRKLEGQRVCDECPYDEDFNCLGCSDVLRQAIALLRDQNETDTTIDPCKSCQEWECNGCEWLKRTEGR